MNKLLFLSLFVIYFISENGYSQNNKIRIEATLIPETNELQIFQEITYFNNSNVVLQNVFLNNWPNSYKNNNTPLAKRFIDKNLKKFHFAKKKHRGNTLINRIADSNNAELLFESSAENPDILKIILRKSLSPKDSIKLKINYKIQIPNEKFTRYGATSYSYNLRYWYLIPAVFEKEWKNYNNLDLDDLYVDFSNYDIKFIIPENYVLTSDMTVSYTLNEEKNTYHLIGKNYNDVEVNISMINDFYRYNSDPVSIITNINSDKVNSNDKIEILNKQLSFIQTFLGEFPHNKLLLNKTDYEKNPVYGFNQLPKFLRPFDDDFEWDIKLFKVLVKKYIESVFKFNKREDIWLSDGLQNYLMIKYIEKFYPDMKALGNVNKVWGIRDYNVAQMDFNNKYYYVYQFAARKNLDQPLITPADSLSNFNFKMSNKYKAGIGLKFLEEYLGEEVVEKAIVNFSRENSGKKTKSNSIFKHINTSKNIDWFKGDYLNTNKKIDYKLKKVTIVGDSLKIEVKNKRKFTTPIKLFGLNNEEKVVFEKWITNVDSVSVFSILKKNIDKLSLNYDLYLPESNLKNNWIKVNRKILARPLQLRVIKDIENPYYNQLFYTPVFGFNYYDGFILGLALSNKTFLKKSFTFKVTPSLGAKSGKLTGSYAFLYDFLPENRKVNKISFGLLGNHFDYDNDLSYSRLVPFGLIEFKKKNFRDISNNIIMASYVMVDKESPKTEIVDNETLKYGVFNLGYSFKKANIVKNFGFTTNFQFAEKFSKISFETGYKILTNSNTQFDFRFFAGAFLKNKTNTDFFSFALDRPTDYLFQYGYFGRSEASGFFSQQIIINEGGFKSILPVPYANQWITSINTSIGTWRWLEYYNDVAFLKNRNSKPYFAYENGIRLNFIQNILELYFPMYSNLGWEVTQANYSSKIRFVIVLNPKRIYNFLRRGFY